MNKMGMCRWHMPILFIQIYFRPCRMGDRGL